MNGKSKELILPAKYRKPEVSERESALNSITMKDVAIMRSKMAAEVEAHIRAQLKGEQAQMLRDGLIAEGWLPPDATCENCGKQCQHNEVVVMCRDLKPKQKGN